MPEPIIIYDYNPQWPDMYETERRRICDVIGNKILAIEHIGSTAVPRLGAKPIIDIMVAVNHMSDSLKCKEPLIKLGYVYHFWPAFPERCFFCESSIGASKYHIHMTEFMSDFWKEKLTFRDYLRTHRNTAQEYCRLKKIWAERYGVDREKYEAYTEAKTDFIQSVLDRARTESE